jgi:hypothetical protein
LDEKGGVPGLGVKLLAVVLEHLVEGGLVLVWEDGEAGAQSMPDGIAGDGRFAFGGLRAGTLLSVPAIG